MIIYDTSQSSIPDGYTNCPLSYATYNDYKNAYPNRINNIVVTGKQYVQHLVLLIYLLHLMENLLFMCVALHDSRL
jgi:hypothetical protein